MPGDDLAGIAEATIAEEVMKAVSTAIGATLGAVVEAAT